VNSCPQKRGKAGKHSEALMPAVLVAPGAQVLVALGEIDQVTLPGRRVEQATAELGE